MEKNYPSFDICNLNTNKLSNDLFNVDRFHGYIRNNPHIHKVHKHSFYHLAYFTEGAGEHILDFESYPIKKGVIYFMRPNQVHNWTFDGKVDGYVMNFSNTFFDQLSIGSHVVDQFSFFNLFAPSQVFEMNNETQRKVGFLFEQILAESEQDKKYMALNIASYMLQLFVLVARDAGSDQPVFNRGNNNAMLAKKFTELIEENFREIRLPKDYAAHVVHYF